MSVWKKRALRDGTNHFLVDEMQGRKMLEILLHKARAEKQRYDKLNTKMQRESALIYGKLIHTMKTENFQMTYATGVSYLNRLTELKATLSLKDSFDVFVKTFEHTLKKGDVKTVYVKMVEKQLWARLGSSMEYTERILREFEEKRPFQKDVPEFPQHHYDPTEVMSLIKTAAKKENIRFNKITLDLILDSYLSKHQFVDDDDVEND